MAAPDHFGKGGAVAGRAGAPDLDDGVGGKGQIEIEKVLFPDDRGQRMGVDEREGVVEEGLEVGCHLRERHVVRVGVDLVAAEVE